MTLEELRSKVRAWDQQGNGSSIATSHYESILNQLDYHATKEWRVYLPAQHSGFNPSYMERLAAWIGNSTDEDDQKLLLEYALYISFLSHDDFAALYRTAFSREISRWIAKNIKADLQSSGSAGYFKQLNDALHRRTWFCPVTDSMDINEFHKVNHLQGVGHRPAFYTLHMLAECVGPSSQELPQRVLAYMANPNIDPLKPYPSLDYIVLLEDIVGSGNQSLPTLQWALKKLSKPILFVPLILCPNGATALRAEEQKWGGLLTVKPVIELGRGDLLGPERQNQAGWPRATQMESLVSKYQSQASPHSDPFGYENTGCSLVTFSNTPDNTVSLVHTDRVTTWKALFPRIFRE